MAAAKEKSPAEDTAVAGVRVLIVDNEVAHARAVAESLERIGFECEVADSGPKGAARLESPAPLDIVVTDLMMSEVDGLEILRRAKASHPDCEVILVTGHGSVDTAVAAMQEGAFHYLQKPLDMSQLRLVVQKAADSLRLRRTNVELNQRLDEKYGFEKFIGRSSLMLEMINRIRRIAPTDVTVLIQGETGTGKELVAQAIHQNSPRKKKPFVALNCAALSENILESELFGHIKGAFTDASADRIGKFEYAHGGTLLLDEVGDMPMATQIKLLRVLENGEITRVGSNDVVQVNVRLLSSTNRDLEALVSSGSFRSDLYHRLKVVTVDLPRLADRPDDVLPLVDHFRQEFVDRHNKASKGVTGAASRKLVSYDWPGNVRQLRNVVESMVVVDIDGVLDVDDLPTELADVPDAAPQVSVGDSARLQSLTLEEIERLVIVERLEHNEANRELAAESLGISERTLYRKIKEYEI
ncbi:MAG: sigma-54-dependent Fis family transcriptional regulator [Planctomycetes bacterium]|nr:sigma-54-dependent Fis family transcriptional regulator [Planctomycetota bacterium]